MSSNSNTEKSSPQVDSISGLDPDQLIEEDEVSEQELREMYDSYEIERYLTLFSAYVNEVRVPEKGCQTSPQRNVNISTTSQPTPDNISMTSISSEASPYTGSLLEAVVLRWLVPLLPPAKSSPHAFTIGKLRLTAQRLYLAVEPVYVPFFRHMGDLANWNDRKTSLTYCVIFWILWYHDLLLPFFVLRILYSLVRRRIMPYPTLVELREHQREISRATAFSDQISNRLSVSSSFGFREMWRLFRVAAQNNKHEPKALPTKKNEIDDDSNPTQDDDTTILDEPESKQASRDNKRLILNVLGEMADLHERVKNIFIWRRPSSSRLYGILLLALFLLTLLVPARYLSKATYFVGGMLFWHIPPVLAALSPPDRLRLPPAFADAPTDADYALELVAHRVAAGLDIDLPATTKYGKRPMRNDSVGDTGNVLKNNHDQGAKPDQSVNWKKWAQRAAVAKTWVDDGRHLMIGKNTPPVASSNLTQGLSDTVRPERITSNHTYPAQHASGPGLITLTNTMLLFTPLLSLEPKLKISLTNVRGVKKIGVVKGLLIKFSLEESEIEEKFRWIGDRDGLFARLVGSKGIGLLIV